MSEGKPVQSRWVSLVIVLTIFVGLLVSQFFVDNLRVYSIIVKIIPYTYGVIGLYFFSRIITNLPTIVEKLKKLFKTEE